MGIYRNFARAHWVQITVASVGAVLVVLNTLFLADDIREALNSWAFSLQLLLVVGVFAIVVLVMQHRRIERLQASANDSWPSSVALDEWRAGLDRAFADQSRAIAEATRKQAEITDRLAKAEGDLVTALRRLMAEDIASLLEGSGDGYYGFDANEYRKGHAPLLVGPRTNAWQEIQAIHGSLWPGGWGGTGAVMGERYRAQGEDAVSDEYLTRYRHAMFAIEQHRAAVRSKLAQIPDIKRQAVRDVGLALSARKSTKTVG